MPGSDSRAVLLLHVSLARQRKCAVWADCFTTRVGPVTRLYSPGLGRISKRSGVACTDCHMPPAGKSAESFGKYEGDVKSHIVKISIATQDKMFTDDGKIATGKLTVDFACLRCHGDRDIKWARSNAKGVHSRGKK